MIDGVHRLLLADVVEVIEHGIIDLAIITHQQPLCGLNESLVIIHFQHAVEVAFSISVKTVRVGHLERIAQQFMGGCHRLVAKGIRTDHAADSLGHISHLKTAPGFREHFAQRRLGTAAADLLQGIHQPDA